MAAGLVVMAVRESAAEIATGAITASLIAAAGRLEAVGGLVLSGLARLGGISYGLYLIHVPVGPQRQPTSPVTTTQLPHA
jgi:peptidoglycan/LPS O-acetylase OafA/YrhL